MLFQYVTEDLLFLKSSLELRLNFFFFLSVPMFGFSSLGIPILRNLYLLRYYLSCLSTIIFSSSLCFCLLGSSIALHTFASSMHLLKKQIPLRIYSSLSNFLLNLYYWGLFLPSLLFHFWSTQLWFHILL